MIGLVVAVLVAAVDASAPPAADYVREVEAWRREREARLRAPDGWLTLVGLTWLHAGVNRFGSAPDDEVRLPAPAPPHAGTLAVDGGAVRVALAPGVTATLDGRPWKPAGAVPLRTDAGDAAPELVGFGGVTLQVIERGGRLGARVKDTEAATRRRFAGLAFFPVAPAFRTVAKYEARGTPTELVIPDSSGGRQRLASPGTLTFKLGARAFTVDPVRDGPDDADLLLVFRDSTSGRETYGGGRFLRALRQPDGSYLVDFNRAYSPPCAFTPYATCPLPPPQNRLPIAIAAGEKAPPEH